MLCKKCLVDKEQNDFYAKRRVCKSCLLLKYSQEFVSVKKVKPVAGDYRKCIFCDEFLDTSLFYGDKTKCIICTKECDLFRTNSIEKFFLPGSLEEIHRWVMEVIIPELNNELKRKNYKKY